MLENAPNSPGLEISEGICIQRYNTVVTPAKRFSVKISNSLSAMFMFCFYIYKMFIECAKLFGNELKGRTEVNFATEVSLY